MRSSVFFHQVSFLLTGIFQTMGAQWLYYQGAADKTSFLTVAATYAGMFLVFLVTPTSTSSILSLFYRLTGVVSGSVGLGGVGGRSRKLRTSNPDPETIIHTGQLYKKKNGGSSNTLKQVLESPKQEHPEIIEKSRLDFSPTVSVVNEAEGIVGSNGSPSASSPSHRLLDSKGSEESLQQPHPIQTLSIFQVVPAYLIFCVSLCEVAAHVIGTAGLFLVGSGVFQVVYSSVVIFTAFLSRLFLKKSLTWKQWLAIFIITIGLCISALGNPTHHSPVHHSDTPTKKLIQDHLVSLSGEDRNETLSLDISKEALDDSVASKSKIFGILVTLTGTFFFACTYVLNETVLCKAKGKISSEEVCSTVGGMGLSICSLYILFYTLPRWNTLVTIPMQEHGAQPTTVIFTFILLIFASFMHSFSYFQLIGSIGATSTGVLQALRAIGVFSMSALIFCQKDSGQCFTSYKALATFIVCLGVIFFNSNFARKR